MKILQRTKLPLSCFTVFHLQHRLFSFKDQLSATMGRKTLTREDRIALAQKRGYSVQTTPDRQNLLSQTEQSSLADVTKERHEDVGELWQEYV
jgi:hypothetical protein